MSGRILLPPKADGARVKLRPREPATQMSLPSPVPRA